jgi:hypothetical protein
MKLLWKTHDPSREDTPIYLVTFETTRLVGARNTSCTQLLWITCNPSRKGTLDVRSYCGKTAIQAGKAHVFP